MSFRGGRGGFRGGRGGGTKPGGGPIIPKELEVNPDFGPTEQFPEYAIPFQDPLTASERVHIARFRDHRDKIHNGPLYTVLAKKRGLEDPFEDVITYSAKKYHKQKRKVPKLDSRPYVFEYFPVELWETMDPGYVSGLQGEKPGVATAKKERKRLLIASLNTALPNGDGYLESEGSDLEGEEKEKEKRTGLLASLMNDDEEDVISGDDGNEDEEERDEEGEDEDEYQDDEEGDYNAEQYFDDGEGEGDFGDDDRGGGAFYD